MRRKGSPYEIKDRWSIRAKEFAWLVGVCWWRGHKRPGAFGGGFKPCMRCER